MAHPYWFGVKVELVCMACCITSIEKNAVNSNTDDMAKIKAKIESQPLRCLHCGEPLQDGVEVDLQIVADTRESLFRQGFAVPEMPGDR
jgi:hypothetical protein